MSRILSLTIGIPAYNEQENIVQLLNSLLKQKHSKYLLKKIIVVSDCSTDKTDQLVKTIRSPKLLLIRNSYRSGQSASQNIILKRSNTDILILLNADIKITDPEFLNKLITPFVQDKKLGLVVPRNLCLHPKGVFANIINFSVELKNELFENWRSGNNIYTCRGTGRALSRQSYKKLTWPKIISEDAYSYLINKQNNYGYKYLTNTAIYYKSPTNFKDHQRQSARFLNNKIELMKLFPKNVIKDEFEYPENMYTSTLIKYFLKNPLYFFSYCLIVFLVRVLPKPKLSVIWDTSKSTKQIN